MRSPSANSRAGKYCCSDESANLKWTSIRNPVAGWPERSRPRCSKSPEEARSWTPFCPTAAPSSYFSLLRAQSPGQEFLCLSCFCGLHLSEHHVKLFRRQSFAAKERPQSVHQEQLNPDKFSKEVFIKRTDTVEPWPSNI
jgi:hypothetical protein